MSKSKGWVNQGVKIWLLGALLMLSLSACTTVPVNQPSAERQQALAEQRREAQQQQFLRGKALFINKEYVKAAQILLPLAGQGHLDAQYTVGYMYHYGYGVPRNEKESTRWIAIAATRGHPLAQEALARINASHDQKGPVSEPVSKP